MFRTKPIRFSTLLCTCLTAALATTAAVAQPTEDDYYPIQTYTLPKDLVLEVGGIAMLKDGRPLVCTRRGEVFIVENAYGEKGDLPATFKPFAFGLSQPLGLLVDGDWIYTAQRGELTRMKDTDGDDRADVFETVADFWEISGNYHEYCFGPVKGKDGDLWVTLNKPFGGEPWGKADWRGWAVKVNPKTGKVAPMAVGLRSPAGVAASPTGEIFFTDNQGEWCNASKLSHIEFGDFHGHPHGLMTVNHPDSPIKSPKPGEVPSGEYMKDLKAKIPNFKMPAVWFPYVKMGKSPCGLVWDTTGGKFGPFEGQIMVSDQHSALIMRVFLEKVDGHYQGAAFPFRKGFQCGITRVEWGKDGSLFVGMSNRGWGGAGNAPYGLQRVTWTGKVPFEMHEMRARPNGFEITFTKPVDKAAAGDPASYKIKSYTYRLRGAYGGPEEDTQDVPVTAVKVADDGLSVVLTCDNLRAGYVHELHADGVKSAKNLPLLHPQAYYTLVNIPK